MKLPALTVLKLAEPPDETTIPSPNSSRLLLAGLPGVALIVMGMPRLSWQMVRTLMFGARGADALRPARSRSKTVRHRNGCRLDGSGDRRPSLRIARGAFNSPFTMNGSPSMKPVPGKRCFGDRS